MPELQRQWCNKGLEELGELQGIVWHNHHMLPRHMGGSDEPSNIVRVNVPMHAFLHKCLWEEYGQWEDLLAWKTLSGHMPFDEARQIAIQEGGRRNRTSEERVKVSQRFKGPKATEHQAKITASLQERYRNGAHGYGFGKKWYTDGVRDVLAVGCPNGFVLGKTSSKNYRHSKKSINKISRSHRKHFRMYGHHSKGRSWYNNGVLEVMEFSCPRGFIVGRIKKKK